MNQLNTLPKQSSITITPVKNGFVVTVPKPYKPMSDMMPDFGEMMGRAMQGMDGDEVMAALRESKISTSDGGTIYDLIPDEYTFIFDSFEKVLGFLSTTYITK